MPRDVDYGDMKRDLEGLDDVKAAHSLHVWSLTVDKVAVAVHLAVGQYPGLLVRAPGCGPVCCSIVRAPVSGIGCQCVNHGTRHGFTML